MNNHSTDELNECKNKFKQKIFNENNNQSDHYNHITIIRNQSKSYSQVLFQILELKKHSKIIAKTPKIENNIDIFSS